MRVLVPLDGSELSEYAVGNAAELARGMTPPATIILARLIHLSPLSAGSFGEYYNQAISEATIAAHDYLRAIEYWPTLDHLTVKRYVDSEYGQIARWIREVAHEEQADLIVMSSHGRSGIMKTLLGNTAQDVARTAEIPTIICRPNAPPAHDARPADPFTVLVPLDSSALSEEIVSMAMQVASALHGKLRFLQVLPSPSVDSAADRAELDLASGYLLSWHERVRDAGLDSEVCTAFGDPVTQILQFAQEGQCDMIAIATHGRVGVERYFMGSVAGPVIEQSPVPVLVFHPQMK